MPDTDWAWPKLIESLQRDISNLQHSVEGMRKDAIEAREAHRNDIEELIRQLSRVKSELAPIVTERARSDELAAKTRWAWIERVGWAAMGFIALAVWEFIRRKVA